MPAASPAPLPSDPPQVRIGYGSAYDVLVAAAAVADLRWRETFRAGDAAHHRALATLGARTTNRITRLGRFGWLNLVGLAPLAAVRPWRLADLIGVVARTDPRRVHLVMIGAERRQLVELAGSETLASALDGAGPARNRLRAILAGDDLTVEVAPWLLANDSATVHAELVDLLARWPQVLPSEAEETLLAERQEQGLRSGELLRAAGPAAFIETVAGGVHFEPPSPRPVVAIASDAVAPVVVVVDGLDHTTLIHPPVGVDTGGDDHTRLLALTRAVGDQTRLELLELVRTGPQSATALAAALGAPRTTLLHHLAILRAAGLIEVTVTPGGPTVYRVRPDAFAELARLAEGFGTTG